MKKKIAVVVAAMLMVAVFLVACGTPAEETPATEEPAAEETAAQEPAEETPAEETSEEPAESTGEKETLVLGYSFRSLDEAMTRWWGRTEELIEEYNAGDNPYTIEAHFTNADQNVDTQISDVESLIVRDPDVILIQCVDAEGSVPAFEACVDAGIKVVDFGFGVSGDAYDVTYKTINHYYAGQLQAEWINNYLEENPEEELFIGYINGLAAVQQMAERYQGFEDNLDTERATILSQQHADFQASKAMSIAEDWIQAHPEINSIVSANDEMCVGGLQAMKAANIPVIALGMDGGEGALQEIQDGYMSATIAFDFGIIAEEGFKLAIAVATGEQTEKEVDISEKVTVVIDASNVAEWI